MITALQQTAYVAVKLTTVVAYVALVTNGCGWWAAPMIALWFTVRRPKAAA